jgi:hypothetical protein
MRVFGFVFGFDNEKQARTMIRVLARTMQLGTSKCYNVKRIDYSGPHYKSKVVAWELEWRPNLYVKEWNAKRTKEEANAGRTYFPYVMNDHTESMNHARLAAYCSGFVYAAKRTNNPGF